ncbi:MAG TPA: hypothetical protein VJB94_02325 [Candidatus Nanoarchaeia archaeon]|nr:hypothetical protein [Candidatus Nanoarchaeia archaeon]
MGGGKRKYNQKIRFRKFKKEEAQEVEVKKEAPKEDDVKALLDLWQSKKKDEKKNEANNH